MEKKAKEKRERTIDEFAWLYFGLLNGVAPVSAAKVRDRGESRGGEGLFREERDFPLPADHYEVWNIAPASRPLHSADPISPKNSHRLTTCEAPSVPR